MPPTNYPLPKGLTKATAEEELPLPKGGMVLQLKQRSQPTTQRRQLKSLHRANAEKQEAEPYWGGFVKVEYKALVALQWKGTASVTSVSNQLAPLCVCRDVWQLAGESYAVTFTGKNHSSSAAVRSAGQTTTMRICACKVGCGRR